MELSPDCSNATVPMVCLQSGDHTTVATITMTQEYSVWVCVLYKYLLIIVYFGNCVNNSVFMQSLIEVETTFVWLVVVVRERAEWRCFMKESGALCVMSSGIVMKQKWHVDNWDS